MHKILFIPVFCLLLTPLFAENSASGDLILNGKDYAMKSAIAKTAENPFDETKKDIVILLTDSPVPMDRFEMGSLYEMSLQGKVRGVIVTLNEDKECSGLVILGVAQKSGNNVCDFSATEFEENRVEGSVYINSQESFGHTYEFDLKFAVDVEDTFVPPVDEVTGDPLPPDGGEPGRSYMEYDRAIATGNVGVLKKYAPNAEAAKQLESPDSKQVLEMMKSMRPTGIRILKGFINDDRATLYLEGNDSMSSGTVTGTIRMVRVKGIWRIEKESWKE